MEFSMLDPETIIILQKLADVKTQYETRLTELKSQFLRLQGMLESGIKLKKSSVSSLLSRLKNDGILIFDGTGYSAKI
jgi:hypothetical protein